MVNPAELRKKSKAKILELVKDVELPLDQVSAQLCQYNDWKMTTNAGLINELHLSGFIKITDGMVSLNYGRS